MSPKSIADALVRAKIAPAERHPDAVFARQYIKGWIKAIRWAEKQSWKDVKGLWESRVDTKDTSACIPEYLRRAPHAGMVTFAFYRGYKSKERRPYLGDIEYALVHAPPGCSAVIVKEIHEAFARWISRVGERNVAA